MQKVRCAREIAMRISGARQALLMRRLVASSKDVGRVPEPAGSIARLNES